jgi:Domain of unknown function (DUF5666)
MENWLMRLGLVVVWCGTMWCQTPSPVSLMNPATEKRAQAPASPSPDVSLDPNSLLPKLTPPSGKTTLVGGTIARLDRVRDQIVIRPFGGGEMRVLFDGRTQVWNGRSKATSRVLQIGQKAYVDTLLDGTTIFAKNIRVVPHGTAGESRGQVVALDSARSEMTLNDGLSPEPFRVRILPGTKIMRDDRETSTGALQPGTLVAVKFQPAEDGPVSARQISILAEPGASFTFIGRVTFLDLHRGLVVLTDPRDKKAYEVHFNPAKVRITGDLHLDSEVTVDAAFNGTNYATSAIMVSPSTD